MNEISLGQYALPALQAAILALVFKTFTVPDRLKPWASVALGVALALTAMAYRGLPWTAVNVIDYAGYGVMSLGLAAVGAFEIQKQTRGV